MECKIVRELKTYIVLVVPTQPAGVSLQVIGGNSKVVACTTWSAPSPAINFRILHATPFLVLATSFQASPLRVLVTSLVVDDDEDDVVVVVVVVVIVVVVVNVIINM